MKILEKCFHVRLTFPQSPKTIIFFLVTFLKYIFISAQQNTWLEKRLVQVLADVYRFNWYTRKKIADNEE